MAYPKTAPVLCCRWVEQDPLQILASVTACIEAVLDKIRDNGFSAGDIKAVGLTNQRETTVVWDRQTGLPLHNAIVWLDTRTTSTVDRLVHNTPTNSKDYLQVCRWQAVGLPVSAYTHPP